MTGNHFYNTPEALLGRNDSKNPATTCRGITTSGRPCRRALALSSQVRETSDATAAGVVTLSKLDNIIVDARFFCWQHKDQATGNEVGQPAGEDSSRRTETLELKNRSSIDTLMQKLGVQDDTAKTTTAAIRGREKHSHNRRSDAAKAKHVHQSYSSYLDTKPSQKVPAQQTTPSFWRSLCCMIDVDKDDTIEIVRRRNRISQQKTSNMPQVVKCVQQPQRPQHDPLTLLPRDLPARTASALLVELSKPISVHDEEGYIYIFWLTPSQRQHPRESVAQSLLSYSPREDRRRRLSDVMTEFSYDDQMDDERYARKHKKKTILLKIGRANNVTRRMNEWQRQCGHHLNLVRWYPHNASTPAQSPVHTPSRSTNSTGLSPGLAHGDTATTGTRVQKVQDVKRVERLIHLELAESQVRRACSACGHEHREWFEVEANEASVRKVDAIIRRWVRWSAQGQTG